MDLPLQSYVIKKPVHPYVVFIHGQENAIKFTVIWLVIHVINPSCNYNQNQNRIDITVSYCLC